MYFVDKQHIVFVERGEHASQVAGFVEDRSGGHFESHPKLVGDDVRQRGLAQPRRSVEQRVVEALAAPLCRLNKHPQILNNLLLSVEVLKALGPQGSLEILVRLLSLIAYVKIFFHNHKSSN